ncbi:MAG: hypothetical protein JGK37_18175 [Microcoleus sp. PH2017_06_SFM_O_A]|nr:hypothetical protein [Microcoleus sp. PH2017_06_SFM_O_A]
MQSLRNRVSEKISIGWQNISRATGFRLTIHQVKKPDSNIKFKTIIELIAFNRRRIGETQAERQESFKG